MALDLAGLIQAAQLGRSLNPEVMQQQALGNQLAQQLQQLQIAKAIRDQEDYFNPDAANLRKLRASLSGQLGTIQVDPLTGTAVTQTPAAIPFTEAQLLSQEAATPAGTAFVAPTAAAGRPIVPYLYAGNPTGLGASVDLAIQQAAPQSAINKIINPPSPYNLSQGEKRFGFNPVTQQDELIAENAPKGATQTPLRFEKVGNTVFAFNPITGQKVSETVVPPGFESKVTSNGLFIGKPDDPSSYKLAAGTGPANQGDASQQYQLERVDRIKDSIDRIKQSVNSGTTGRSASLQGGTFFPKFLQGRDYVKLRADLESLKANIFTKELQAMRASSKTGGAIGNVSNLEGTRLSNALVALEQELDAPDLIANLDIAYDSIEKYRKELEKQGGGVNTSSQPQATVPTVNSKSEYDALPPNSEYIEDGKKYRKP